MVFNPVITDLKIIIPDIVRTPKPQADSKNLTINIDIKISEIQADQEMLKTIIRNLLSNAVKFTEAGGAIWITATSGKTKNENIISVKDSGAGIAAEKIERIFNLEEKTSTRSTRDEKGIGLGLILCKELAEKHQGSIQIESVVGKGSPFSITLPTES